MALLMLALIAPWVVSFECARVRSVVGSARVSDASDLACEVTLELSVILAEDVWDRLLGVENGERGEKG